MGVAAGQEPDEVKLTVSGVALRLSPDRVVKALDNVEPERVRNHAVVVGTRWFPVKQAFEAVSGLDRLDFNTEQARSAFRKLGFEVRRVS